MQRDFDAYWDELVQKNAGLSSSETKMTVSVASFRAALRRAYQQGETDGIDFQKRLGAAPSSLFDAIFGKDR